MELDRELYRKYYNELSRWNDEEEIQRVLDARKLTPEQAWNRYILLWELLEQFASDDKEARHQNHLRELASYYSAAQKYQVFLAKNGE